MNARDKRPKVGESTELWSQRRVISMRSLNTPCAQRWGEVARGAPPTGQQSPSTAFSSNQTPHKTFNLAILIPWTFGHLNYLLTQFVFLFYSVIPATKIPAPSLRPSHFLNLSLTPSQPRPIPDPQPCLLPISELLPLGARTLPITWNRPGPKRPQSASGSRPPEDRVRGPQV